MSLILAIVADQQQAAQLGALVRARLSVELVKAAEVGEGLLALNDRVPDLILTSPLMSPFDDGVLDEYLRELGPAGAHVQTLRIPVLSQGPAKESRLGFSLLRRPKAASAPDGCDPKVFAEEIAQYLARATEEKLNALSQRRTDSERFEQSDVPTPKHHAETWSVAESSDIPVAEKQPDWEPVYWRGDDGSQQPAENAAAPEPLTPLYETPDATRLYTPVEDEQAPFAPSTQYGIEPGRTQETPWSSATTPAVSILKEETPIVTAPAEVETFEAPEVPIFAPATVTTTEPDRGQEMPWHNAATDLPADTILAPPPEEEELSLEPADAGAESLEPLNVAEFESPIFEHAEPLPAPVTESSTAGERRTEYIFDLAPADEPLTDIVDPIFFAAPLADTAVPPVPEPEPVVLVAPVPDPVVVVAPVADTAAPAVPEPEPVVSAAPVPDPVVVAAPVADTAAPPVAEAKPVVSVASVPDPVASAAPVPDQKSSAGVPEPAVAHKATASFKAALAAIRAAWRSPSTSNTRLITMAPDSPPEPAPSIEPPPTKEPEIVERPDSLLAAPDNEAALEVDLTGAVELLDEELSTEEEDLSPMTQVEAPPQPLAASDAVRLVNPPEKADTHADDIHELVEEVYELTVEPDLRELESQLLVPLAPPPRPSTDAALAQPPVSEERVETKERPEPRSGRRKKSGKSATKATRNKKAPPPPAPPGPVQDEWGIFDPNQCGFAALVDKLDKVSEEKPERDPRTKVRLISYR